ncbi:Acriflavin resistance protein, partial [mine drainage metagenome]
YLSFYSHHMRQPEIADYLTRVVQPQLESVNGVAQAAILGSPFAMRIWLAPNRLVAYHLTPTQVVDAIAANNYIAAVGRTKSRHVAINVNAQTGLHTVRQFKRLIVLQSGHQLVRLGELGRVELGDENDNGRFIFDGRRAVAIAIDTAPDRQPAHGGDGYSQADFPR